MSKKITSILLVGILFLSCSLSSSALSLEQRSGIMILQDPRFQGLISITTSLEEDPVGYACPVYTFVCDLTKMDRLRVKTTLQKYSGGWQDVKTWDKTIVLSESVYTYYEEYKVTDRNKSYRFLFYIEAKMGSTIVDTTSGESLARVI